MLFEAMAGGQRNFYASDIEKLIRDFARKVKQDPPELQQSTENTPAAEETVKASLTIVRRGSIIRVLFLITYE